MKIYIISFKGVWIGGLAVILADDKEEVLKLIKKRMKEDPLLQESNTRKIFKINEYDCNENESRIIHFENGDY